MGLDVDDLEVGVDHRQVEASLVRNFGVSFVDWLALDCLGYDYLDFADWEASLLECCAVLAKEDLLLVWVIRLT